MKNYDSIDDREFEMSIHGHREVDNINWTKWTPNSVKVTKVQLPLCFGKPQDHKFATFIEGILTREECEALIQVTEGKGYQKAQINSGQGYQYMNLDKRNSDRSIIDSVQVANVFWERIKPFIPEGLYKKQDAQALGINERLRFLRYDKGGYFKPHNDGQYHREGVFPLEKSMLTIQLYLNEGFKGGQTTFVGSLDDGTFERNVPVVPKIGSVLIFAQNIFHEGSEV